MTETTDLIEVEGRLLKLADMLAETDATLAHAVWRVFEASEHAPRGAFISDLRTVLSTLEEVRGRLISSVADEQAAPASGLRPSDAGLAGQEEALRWFVKVLNGCEGRADASDYRWSPLNVFCDDFEPLDTFNLAIERGFTTTSHDSDFDTSTVFLTDKGRAWLADPLPQSPTQSESEATLARTALEGALEAMTTICEWFSQREQGGPTTNSEAAIFQRLSNAAAQVEGTLGLSAPTQSETEGKS